MHETNFPNGIRLENLKGHSNETLALDANGILVSSTATSGITGGLAQLESRFVDISGGSYVYTGISNQVVRGVKVFDEAYCKSTRIVEFPTLTGDYVNKTVTIGPSKVVLFTSTNGTGNTNLFTIPTTTVTLPGSADGNMAILYADYNSGNPTYKAMEASATGIINCSNNIPIARTTLWGGSVLMETINRTFLWDDVTYVKPLVSMITPDFGKQGINDIGIYIGNNCGNTTGGASQNVFIGSNTGRSANGGIRNVFIGANNAATVTTATHTTLIGTGADVRNGNDHSAVAVGFMTHADSMATVVGGGSYAQSTQAYGQRTVAIGYEAQTNQDYSVVVGASSKSTAQNAAVIGTYGTNSESNTIQFGSSTAPYDKVKVQTSLGSVDLLANSGTIDAQLPMMMADAYNQGGIEYYNSSLTSWGTLSNLISISGASSSATGIIRSATLTTAGAGYLSLSSITGDFIDGEQITSSLGKNATIKTFKKKLIGLQKIPVTSSNGLMCYGLPYGMAQAISGAGTGILYADHLFWLSDNQHAIFASPGFNSDIIIQKNYTGSTVSSNQLSLGWEGNFAPLTVGGNIVFQSWMGTDLRIPVQTLFQNTTQSTSKITGSVIYSGGVAISGNLFSANTYVDTISVANLTGNDNNFVIHDATGKLLDSGVSLSTLDTRYLTSSSISVSATSIVDTFNVTEDGAVEWLVMVSNGSQKRTSKVIAIYDTTNISSYETKTDDIGGSTAALTLNTSIVGGQVRLNSSSLSGVWTVKAKRITV